MTERHTLTLAQAGEVALPGYGVLFLSCSSGINRIPIAIRSVETCFARKKSVINPFIPGAKKNRSYPWLAPSTTM
jgi:hypothetical protein